MTLKQYINKIVSIYNDNSLSSNMKESIILGFFQQNEKMYERSKIIKIIKILKSKGLDEEILYAMTVYADIK